MQHDHVLTVRSGGGGSAVKMIATMLLYFVILFDLICNMTMLWKNEFWSIDLIHRVGMGVWGYARKIFATMLMHLWFPFIIPTLFMPPPFIMGGGAYSITLVRTSVRTYVHTYLHTYVRTKNGFQAISFEYIGVLDSYFIHRYKSIKYRSSSITDKIHWLLSELWPLISEWKMVFGLYLLNTLVYWIHNSYTGI